MKWKKNLAEIVLVISGLFLIVERLFIHAISFDYSKIGMTFIDAYFDHWMIGVIFIVIAAVSVWWKK